MFNKKDLAVLDWWLFFVLMAVPGLNLIIAIVLLVSERTNKTLKNYLVALVLPVVAIIILWFAVLAAYVTAGV